jgi:hypothetical protein
MVPPFLTLASLALFDPRLPTLSRDRVADGRRRPHARRGGNPFASTCTATITAMIPGGTDWARLWSRTGSMTISHAGVDLP